jgi:hypothetical protein
MIMACFCAAQVIRQFFFAVNYLRNYRVMAG